MMSTRIIISFTTTTCAKMHQLCFFCWGRGIVHIYCQYLFPLIRGHCSDQRGRFVEKGSIYT